MGCLGAPPAALRSAQAARRAPQPPWRGEGSAGSILGTVNTLASGLQLTWAHSAIDWDCTQVAWGAWRQSCRPGLRAVEHSLQRCAAHRQHHMHPTTLAVQDKLRGLMLPVTGTDCKPSGLHGTSPAHPGRVVLAVSPCLQRIHA